MFQDNITFPLVSWIKVHPRNNAMPGTHCHLRQITQPLFTSLVDITILWICPLCFPIIKNDLLQLI